MLRDNMETLVEDLRAAIDMRREHLEKVARETREALRTYRAQQQDKAGQLQDKARRLREALASQRQRGTRAAQARRRADQQERERTRVSVSEFRSAVHSRVERLGMERHEFSEAQRQRLSADLDELRRAVAQARDAARQGLEGLGGARQEIARALKGTLAAGREALTGAVGPLREELKDDLRQALDLWRGLARPVPKAKAGEAPEQPARTGEGLIELDEEEVFAAIIGHPEGIRLVDIGEELGVPWRSLTGLARNLVEEGRVEKAKNLYYPK